MTPRAETRETTICVRCGKQKVMHEDGVLCDRVGTRSFAPADPSPAPAAGGEATMDASIREQARQLVREGDPLYVAAYQVGQQSRAASPASGGPSVAEQFAALGWDFASVEDAAAELERLSGMVRANVASRIAAENERDDAVRGYRWTASGGPGVGREEGSGRWRGFFTQKELDALALRSPAGPPRETGSARTCAYWQVIPAGGIAKPCDCGKGCDEYANRERAKQQALAERIGARLAAARMSRHGGDRHPQTPCGLCGAVPDVTLHDDGSIRGAMHRCQNVPALGPADPPRTYPRGIHFPLSSSRAPGAASRDTTTGDA